jgi:hypothetical protein
MKSSFLKSSLLLAVTMLFFVACGKSKSNNSNSQATANPVSPVVTVPGETPSTMESMVASFQAKSPLEGLSLNQQFQFTIKTPSNVTPTGGVIGNILNFLNASVYNNTFSYEILKVYSLTGPSIQTGTGTSNPILLGAPVVYSLANDTELNTILNLHNGQAVVQDIRPINFTYNSQTYSGQQISLAKNNKIFTYVLSLSLPLIANPILSIDGVTGVTKSLGNVVFQQ